MSKANNYDLVLEKVGDQPLKTTKILCQVLGLGLAAAKAMVDKAPTTVATGFDRDKALALRDELEAIGNTVSIPGMAIKLETPAKIKKAAEPKKTTAKKSAPTPLTVATPSNDDFDAIFGGSTAKKTTASAKSNDSAKSTPKAKVDKISAAPNDEFDAIFGKGK
ncbi:MAG: ribosomal protein L7/L12 [Clostridia bacterium]|nr:ribosomal protein L7/L12 [Clostridia bacterium]